MWTSVVGVKGVVNIAVGSMGVLVFVAVTVNVGVTVGIREAVGGESAVGVDGAVGEMEMVGVHVAVWAGPQACTLVMSTVNGPLYQNRVCSVPTAWLGSR